MRIFHDKKAQAVSMLVKVAIGVVVFLLVVAFIRSTSDSALRGITDYAQAFNHDYDEDGTNDLMEIVMGRCPCDDEDLEEQQKSKKCITTSAECTQRRSLYYKMGGNALGDDYVSGAKDDPKCTSETIGEACGGTITIGAGEILDPGLCGVSGQCLTYCRFCSKHPGHGKCKGDELKERLENVNVIGIEKGKETEEWPLSNEVVGCFCSKEESNVNIEGKLLPVIGNEDPNMICYMGEVNQYILSEKGGEKGYYCCDSGVISYVAAEKERDRVELAAVNECKDLGDKWVLVAGGGTVAEDKKREARVYVKTCLQNAVQGCINGEDKACGILFVAFEDYVKAYENNPIKIKYSGEEVTIELTGMPSPDSQASNVQIKVPGFAGARNSAEDKIKIITDYDNQFELSYGQTSPLGIIENIYSSGALTTCLKLKPDFYFFSPISCVVKIQRQTFPNGKVGLEFIYSAGYEP